MHSRAIQRVVSLIASSTEMVCALGCQDRLVGISHECDNPADILHLPRCTSTKFVTDGTSYEIDQRVKAIAQEGLAVYRVDADQLKRLNPDLIITQTQCEVCAVSLKDVEAAVREVLRRDVAIVSLHPNALADIWDDIRRVATALDVVKQGESVIAALQARMQDIVERVRLVQVRPRVAYIEWIDPLMAGGNWMPELVTMAGGVNLFGEAGRHSPWMTWEELCVAAPDILIIAPCGFDIARSRREMPTLTKRPEWSHLQAVQKGRIFLADGNRYFNRPGPHVVESLEIVAELCHPQVFEFGHEGEGWQRFV